MGRPKKEETIERERLAAFEEKRAAGRARVKDIITKWMGSVPAAPSRYLEATHGDHWHIPDERQDDLAEVTQIWMGERFGFDLDAPYAVDLALAGMMLFAYGPGIAGEIRKRRGLKVGNGDDAPDTGSDGMRENNTGQVPTKPPRPPYYNRS